MSRGKANGSLCHVILYYAYSQYMSQYTRRGVKAQPLSITLPTCGTSYVPVSGNKLLRT